jgi:hypothetical protein
MRMIRRGTRLACKPGVKGEIRLANRLFDVFEVAA